MSLKAPFPWFGGKSKVAHIVWKRFGDVPSYVEPFAGSLAVLLGRPKHHARRIETVNDLDRFVANFWRAASYDAEAVARHSDWPVNEADLEARHYWLITEGKEKLERVLSDPRGYDAEIAGWWVWGISAWIGSGWCTAAGSWRVDPDGKWIKASPPGIVRQKPHLAGTGMGVHAGGIHRKRPHLSGGGMGAHSTGGLGRILLLRDRLRGVRVTCGDWSRVTSPSVLSAPRGGDDVGIFLDPPYPYDTREADIYVHDSADVAREVERWAIEHGDAYRIAFCGYDAEHHFPRSWEVFEWKATGGYAGQRADGENANAGRERIWFSPRCLPPERQGSIFDALGGGAP